MIGNSVQDEVEAACVLLRNSFLRGLATHKPLQVFSDPVYPRLEAAPFVSTPSSNEIESVFDNGMSLSHTDWVKDGTLTAMCGGKPETLETVKPYFSCMANSILHMGEAGAGQLAKLINQLLFDINCAALAEILPMAVKLGMDAEKIGKIVNSGTGKSYASEFFIPRILKNNFTDGYPLKGAYKDLVSGATVGAQLGVPMPVLAAATATLPMRSRSSGETIGDGLSSITF